MVGMVLVQHRPPHYRTRATVKGTSQSSWGAGGSSLWGKVHSWAQMVLSLNLSSFAC